MGISELFTDNIKKGSVFFLKRIKEINTRFKVILLLAILTTMAFPVNVLAQKDNIRFERLGLEHGLSQVTIYCILQDSQGFMWFGTEDGLNKYDGYNFTVYRHDPDNRTSVGDNSVNSIFEDSGGTLWIGTENGGLNKFDRKQETFTRFQHQADNPHSISHNKIASIFEDSGDTLWIGTKGGGLNKLDRKAETFTRFQHQASNPHSLSHNKVNSIFEDSRGILWIGTGGGGLNKFDRITETFTPFQNQADNPQSLSQDTVSSIFEDSGGTLWIGTWGGGLNKFDRKEEKFTHFQHQVDNPHSLSNNKIHLIFEDSGGTLWIGTGDGKLNKFDRKQKTFTRFQHRVDNPHSLSHNTVSSIFEDSGGTLWIGTGDGGLNKFNRKHKTFTRLQHQADNPHSLSHNTVSSIFEDFGGILWVGTWGGGLNKFDRKLERFTHFQHQADNPHSLSNNIVMSIFEDSGGSLWIGTFGGGLNKFDRKQKTFTRFQHQADNPHSLSQNTVYSVFEDSGATLWIGTGSEGLNKFDRNTETFTRYQHQASNPNSLSHNTVFSILEDSGGTLWIGTGGGGLNKLDRIAETFTPFQHQADNPHSLSDNIVISIFEDSGGTLWIGTCGGLNKFDRKTETFTRFQHQADTPHSLSHNKVYSIFEDSGSSLWIGTAGGGLNKFDRKEERFTHFREKHGLPNDVVYGILEDDKGNLWLSTNKGISKFNPKTGTFTNYDEKDGLQSNEFSLGAFHKDKSGRMYFGGTNGFNEFYPDRIQDNKYIPPVVITNFLLFNKPVPVEKKTSKDGGYQKRGQFKLEQHINFTREITLDYTDYIFALEFSALNYRQPEKNQYAYKLEGFDKDWVKTDYKNRRATYTNLPDGEYIFRVKASNDDGCWNEQGTSLKIKILPPPWKTWWAYTLYALAILGLICWFIRSQRRKVIQKQKELEREKLKELDKAKSRFFANISHEFRTPLTLIMGPMEQLLSNKHDKKETEAINMALENSQRLLLLINQLLDLSKLDSGKLQLRASRQNIIPFLKGLVGSFESMALQKKLELSFLCEEEEIILYFDAEKLEKVIVNLVANAIKFTSAGGKVTVTADICASGSQGGAFREKPLAGATYYPHGPPAKAFDKKYGWLEIVVKDTGIGIPGDQLPYVFDRFYQAGGSRSHEHKQKGTGIGLALVKELVTLHQGEILVKSSKGKGAEFLIRLPLGSDHLKKEEIVEKETPISPRETYRTIGHDGIKQMRIEADSEKKEKKTGAVKKEDEKDIILVVEDNADMRSYMRGPLETLYTVEEAVDGKNGIDIAKKIVPDLIVSDIMMPNVDGYELCKTLKNNVATSHIPIILLTAKASEESMVRGLETGADDYITKPFNIQILLARIKNLIDLRRHLQDKIRNEMVLQPTEIAVSSIDQEFMQELKAVVEKNLSEPEFGVDQLAKALYMGRSTLNRKIKAITGESTNQFIQSYRLKRGAQLLKANFGNVNEVAFEVGFSSSPYFTKCFKEKFHQLPSVYMTTE